MLNTFVNPLNTERCINGDQNTEKTRKQNFYKNSCLNIFLNDILQVYVFNVKVQHTLIIVMSKILKSSEYHFWYFTLHLICSQINKALKCSVFHLIDLMSITMPKPSLAHSGQSKFWAWSQFSILLCYIL